MNLKCVLLGHRFGDWTEVKNHLERRCQRKGCGHIDARFPSLAELLTQFLCECARKGLDVLEKKCS